MPNLHHEVKKETTTYVIDRFEAKRLGAPFKVILLDAVTVKQDKNTGEIISYKIPDLEGLIQATVIARILHPRKLNGEDLKFIRKVICSKQKDLAYKLGLEPETLSRCENGKQTLAEAAEKLFRIFALKSALKLHSLKPCEAKDELEEALDKLFDAIKPVPVFEVANDLILHFTRTTTSECIDSNDSDDGKWNNEIIAA